MIENNVTIPLGAQIALRYPSFKPDYTVVRWHIDGMNKIKV